MDNCNRRQELLDNEHTWILKVLPECSDGLSHDEIKVFIAQTERAYFRNDLIKLIEICSTLTPVYNMLRPKGPPTKSEIIGMIDLLKENGYEVSKKNGDCCGR